LHAGKQLQNGQTLLSMHKKPKTIMTIMVMGSKPDNRLESLDVDDVIGYAFQFLSIEDVYMCRLVCSSWNELALEGSSTNSDRFCFIGTHATICYDMFLKQPVYTVPAPLIGHQMLLEPYNELLFETCKEESFINKSAAYRNMYRGTPLVFTYEHRVEQKGPDHILTCIDVPTGKTVWSQPKLAFKPFSVILKQQTLASQAKIPKPRTEDDELSDLVPEENEENEPVVLHDTLIHVYYNPKTGLVYAQFDTFIAALDPNNGHSVATYDPDVQDEEHRNTRRRPTHQTEDDDDEDMEEQNTRRDRRFDRTLITEPMFDIENAILVPTQQRIVVLDNKSLQQIRTIRVRTVIKRILRHFIEEDHEYFVVETQGGYELLDRFGRNVCHFHETFQLGRENIFNHNGVFSLSEGKEIFHTSKFVTQSAQGRNYFLMFESQENMLEGFYQFYSEELPTEQDKKKKKAPVQGGVRLVSIFKEYREKYVNRQREVTLVASPAIVWETDLKIPASVFQQPMAYCIYGERLYLVLQHTPGTRLQRRRTPEDDEEEMNEEDGEDEEEDEESIDDTLYRTRCFVYCVDVSVGSILWKNVYYSDTAPDQISISIKGLLLLVSNKQRRSNEEVMYIFSQMSGNLYSELEFDQSTPNVSITYT
jgi:hypothetical protein